MAVQDTQRIVHRTIRTVEGFEWVDVHVSLLMSGFAGGEFGVPGTTGRTPADFQSDLGQTDLARHLAFFHQSRENQHQVAAAFIQHGLQTGHRCLYLADVNDPKQITDVFQAAGIDADARRAAGDLVVRDAEAVYLDEGFDPPRMIGTLQAAATESVTDGYDGLWMAGENSWCFHTDVPFDQILEFETEFDATAPELPVTALCQYDLTRFSEEATAKALWTHEQIIYQNAVCENPFYIPPAEYQAMEAPHKNAQLMLEQAYSLKQALQQAERREQRLNVVNRVLRHNIRNEMNVVKGVLEDLVDSGALDDRSQDHVRWALDSADDIVSLAEKARSIQQTVSEATVEQRELTPLVAGAVEQVERSYPNADINVEGTDEHTVLAGQQFETALVEVLTNAVEYQDGEEPAVTVAVSSESSNEVRLEIRNPGPAIPENERRALLQGKETDLEHASGLGLWLIKWLVENARGDVGFQDAGSGGDLQIRLQRIG